MIRPTLVAPPGFEYDVSEWPIFLTIRVGPPTDEAYIKHLAFMDALLDRRELQVHLIDATQNSGGSRPQHMKLLADWNNRNRERLAQYCLGVGMVVQNAVARFGIATMLTLMKRPVPYAVMASRTEAMQWGRGLIAQSQRRSA